MCLFYLEAYSGNADEFFRRDVDYEATRISTEEEVEDHERSSRTSWKEAVWKKVSCSMTYFCTREESDYKTAYWRRDEGCGEDDDAGTRWCCVEILVRGQSLTLTSSQSRLKSQISSD